MRNLPALFFFLSILLGDWCCSAAEVFSDSGFVSELVISLTPYSFMAVTWAPDGRMFIWQKPGIVWIFKNGSLLPTPFLDFSAKVNAYNDNGLMGLAFDPNFSSNGYMYLTYVYEPNGDPNDSGPKMARLVRVTANPTNLDLMLPDSEITILDNFPDDGHTHTLGTIRFASDGTMFFGNGDGTAPDFSDPNASMGAQDLDSARGKIFRVNPDGTAPPDNPFYDGTDSIRSKVWCYGVRNPYRFSLHPVTGWPYFGDLGWYTWEEVDLGIPGGNFGWPCYEGADPNLQYQAVLPQCASVSSVVSPMITYDHSTGDLSEGGTCVIGGDFYTGNQYPEAYRTNYFYADYSGNWIHRAVLDAAGHLVTTAPFATGIAAPTCLEQGPDGLLYYVAFASGEIRRIRYNGVAAVASATPTSGYSPLDVSFSSAGSTNSGGGDLSYFWDFGDGSTSTLANPSHIYSALDVAIFNALLTVSNSTQQSCSMPLKITVGSLPPVPTIVAPTNGTTFMPGQVVFYQGSATDPDDSALPDSSLSWSILIHHDTHTHTGLGGTGSEGSFVVENHGTIGTFSYEIILTATDSSGLMTSTNVLLPIVADTSSPTAPWGLTALPGNGLIVLNWGAATDNAAVQDYIVERQTAGDTNFSQIATVTGTTYKDIGLATTTAYTFRVRASDVSGNLGDYSGLASASALAVPAGLVAAYSFDEGGGTILNDVSGNGNDGTIFEATWTTSGKYGNALVFDGEAANVTINDSASLNLTTAMTLEAWVNPALVTSDWRDLIFKNTDVYYLAATSPNSGQPALDGAFTSGEPLYGPDALPTNAWTHLAGTYDGTTMRLFVNAEQVASRAQSGNIAASANPLQVGGDSVHGQFFQGTLDELRIYNRALDPAEIQSDANTPLSAPSAVALVVPTQTMGQIGTDGFRFFLSANSPGTYTIECSTNLTDWQSLAAVQYTNGLLAIVDTNANQSATSFYRAH